MEVVQWNVIVSKFQEGVEQEQEQEHKEEAGEGGGGGGGGGGGVGGGGGGGAAGRYAVFFHSHFFEHVAFF